MLVSGELDGTLLYLTKRNLVDRSAVDISKVETVRPLFEDKAAEMRRFYAKTGIYPINHTVVIRRSLYEKHPWLALNLYQAFVDAKREADCDTADGLRAFLDTGLIDATAARTALEQDPKAYGMETSRPVVECIAQYLHEQGFTARRVGIEEVFANSMLDL